MTPARASSDGWEANFNAGRDLIEPFLKQQSVRQLDGVMISHAHYDHFGGLLWLADHFPVTRLIDAAYVFPGTAAGNYTGELGHYNKLRDECAHRPRPWHSLHQGVCRCHMSGSFHRQRLSALSTRFGKALPC
jgi:beta-lactamase superfamily II metal-dependent hydrolase